MTEFLKRRDAEFPYQTWKPFPDEAIVQVKNAYGESRIAQAKDLWWGYETECTQTGESVIMLARRLDKVYDQAFLKKYGLEETPEQERIDETKARQFLQAEMDVIFKDIQDIIDYKVNDSISVTDILTDLNWAKRYVYSWVARMLMESVSDEFGPDEVARMFDNIYFQICGGHFGPEDFRQKAKPYRDI